jgi:hypothetical protein
MRKAKEAPEKRTKMALDWREFKVSTGTHRDAKERKERG